MAFYWEERRGSEQVLFRWQGLQSLEAYIKPAANQFYSLHNVLIYVTGGSAAWKINEQTIKLEPGSLAGITVGLPVEIVHAAGLGLKGWAIEFCQYEVLDTDARGGELRLQDWSLPTEQPFMLAIVSEGEVMEQLEQLKQLALPGKGRFGIELELARQQLLYLLLDALYKSADQAIYRRLAQILCAEHR